MKKQIYDEKNGLSYTLHGDYYLPDLVINEEETTYGKYGIMRKQFLKEHRSVKCQYLVLTGNLTVSSPPVVCRGTFSRRGRIMVSGPGQNRSASA